jgi:hypothetical protein
MMGYNNCFWGITPSALRAMLEIANFEVLEEHANMLFLDVVARPIPRESITPPPEFPRNRDRDRRAAFAEDPPPWLIPRRDQARAREGE